MKANNVNRYILFCAVILTLIFMRPVSLFSQNIMLDDYLQYASENNPDIKKAHTEYLMSVERINLSGVLPDPKLAVGYFINPVETRIGAQRAKFSISQSFPWLGTLAAEENISIEKAKSKYELYKSVESKVLFSVKTVWLEIYQIKQKIKYTKKLDKYYKMMEQILISKYENNQSSMADVLTLQMKIDELKNELDYMADQKNTQIAKFNLLLNRREANNILISDSLIISKSLNQVPVLDSVLANNSAIKYLNSESNAMRNQLEMVKLQSLPTFGIGLDYVFVDKRDDVRIANNGKDVIMPMVSMSIPLFRTKYNSRINENRLQIDQVSENQKSVTNQLKLEYKKTNDDLNDSIRRYNLFSSQKDKSRKIIRLLLAKYTETGEDYLDVLSMQQNTIQYEINREIAVADYFTALAKFEYLEN